MERRQYTRESADSLLSAGLCLPLVWSLLLNLAPGLQRQVFSWSYASSATLARLEIKSRWGKVDVEGRKTDEGSRAVLVLGTVRVNVLRSTEPK